MLHWLYFRLNFFCFVTPTIKEGIGLCYSWIKSTTLTVISLKIVHCKFNIRFFAQSFSKTLWLEDSIHNKAPNVFLNTWQKRQNRSPLWFGYFATGERHSLFKQSCKVSGYKRKGDILTLLLRFGQSWVIRKTTVQFCIVSG